MSTMYVVDSRHRRLKGDTAFAKPELPGALSIRDSVASIWRAVARLLGAIDKRMTANLDCRTRLMLYGDGGPPAARRRRK